MTGIDPNVGKEFIEHFGTKGMRWGVRRSRKEREQASGKSSSKGAPDKPKKIVGKTNTVGKNPSNLSDVQLQKMLNRMNMEQQYARLTAPGPTVTQKILRATTKFASEAARGVAMTQVKNIGNEAASQRIASLMTKKKTGQTARNMARLATKNVSFS